MRNNKLQIWLPLIFSIVMIAGMFFGYQLHPGQSGKGFFKPNKGNSLEEALELIKLKYVDSVHLDSMESSAIEEMMTKLDPHSVYFPPLELKEANEELAGNFEGIGVEFNVFRDTVNIVYVIPGGPSDRAGLQIGDKIIKVDNAPLSVKSMSNEDIRKMIRGEGGSTITLTVLRGANVQNIPVTRGRIPVPSLDAAYMIDKTTGYIKLNKFTETSYEEFMQALEGLKKDGLQQLILDLRGNGGGFMGEAVDMADEFLDGDKLVVYTEGVNNKKHEYRCKRNGLFEQGKLSVLVDELSASASEVLSGALQDWDRATIIGRRTFGKGLVQEQYSLTDGSAIRLTVARYYTPLGRSIQRSYDKGKKVYMDELWERYSNGELLYADSNKVNTGKQYKTPKGRIVYGGGGIMTDVFVPIDTSSYSLRISRMLVNGGFNNYVYNYYLDHRQEVDRFTSVSDYLQHFTRVDEMWDGLVKAAAQDSIRLDMATAGEKESLKRRLEAALARYRWRNLGYYEVLNSDDVVIKKALETFAGPTPGRL